MNETASAITELAQLVCDRADRQVVVDWLGRASPTEATIVSVEPRDEAIAEASVSIRADGTVDHVRLGLRGTCTVADLTVVYGEPRELPRVHWGDPIPLVFDVGPGCRLVAGVDEAEPHALVRELTIRSDR